MSHINLPCWNLCSLFSLTSPADMQKSLFPSAAATVTCMKTTTPTHSSLLQMKMSHSFQPFFKGCFLGFWPSVLLSPWLYSHLHKVRNQGFVHRWATVETRLNSGTTRKDQAKPLWDKLKKTSGRQQVKINLQGAPDIRRVSSCCTDPRADPSSQLYIIL